MLNSSTPNPGTKLTRAGVVVLLAAGGMFALVDQSASAAQLLTTQEPSANSYVDTARQNQNFAGTAARQAGRNPHQRSFLTVGVPPVAGKLTKAALKVTATTNAAVGQDVYGVPVTNGNEKTTIDGNQPLFGAKLGTSGPFHANSWTAVDVTPDLPSGGSSAVGIVDRGDHHVSYAGRDAATNMPRLVPELKPTPPPVATQSPATIVTILGAPAPDPAVVRAAFYYPWFVQTWGSNPADPLSVYHPSLGYYSSDDVAVIAKHIAAMRYANLDAAIVSWWGQGKQSEAKRIPLILQAAAGSSFKEALYYEKEGFGNPSATELSADLTYIQSHYTGHPNYLRRGGKPVIMAFADRTDGCAMVDRWKQANAGRFFVVLKVFAGYLGCAAQPDGWHQYAPALAADSQSGLSFSVSPGFWLKGEAGPRLVRDPSRWAADIQRMVASKAPFQLVTTFNEWGEGTAVESSDRMANGSPGGWASTSGYGRYIDLLHANIPSR